MGNFSVRAIRRVLVMAGWVDGSWMVLVFSGSGRSVGRYHLIRDTYHTMLKGVKRGVRMTAGARPHQHNVTILLILFSSSSLFITRKQENRKCPSVYRYAFSLSSPPFTFAKSRTERKEGKKKKRVTPGTPDRKQRKSKEKTKKLKIFLSSKVSAGNPTGLSRTHAGYALKVLHYAVLRIRTTSALVRSRGHAMFYPLGRILVRSWGKGEHNRQSRIAGCSFCLACEYFSG